MRRKLEFDFRHVDLSQFDSGSPLLDPYRTVYESRLITTKHGFLLLQTRSRRGGYSKHIIPGPWSKWEYSKHGETAHVIEEYKRGAYRHLPDVREF